MNRFLDLLKAASEGGWCTRPGCTTCGSSQFREGLRGLGTGLADDLATLDLAELQRRAAWDDALRLALDEIQSSELKDRVLAAWLPQLSLHVRLADIVLFYQVRRGALFAPMSIETLRRWVAACIDIASRTRDESLIESLVYTLGPEYREHPALNSAVLDLARRSVRIARALQRDEAGA